MSAVVLNFGPYGVGESGSTRHVLNALHKCGVPLAVSQGIQVGSKELVMNGRIVAKYKYFQGIEQPLFSGLEDFYMKPRMLVNPEEGTAKYMLRLWMIEHDSGDFLPHLVIPEQDVTAELRKFIKQMWWKTGDNTDPVYQLVKDSLAVFNGIMSDHGRIDIEFWNPAGAQAFVDYINNNFVASVNSR